MKNLDNLHADWSKLLSYNKTWNVIIGERESGKSTDAWLDIWKAFHYKGRPSLIMRRRTVDITTAYIDDTAKILNKFLEEPVQLVYKKGDVGTGIVDVHLAPADIPVTWQTIKNYPMFIRIIALSVPSNRIKSLVVKNVAYMFMDEMLVNLRDGEKYLPGEVFKIKEIFTTYNREAETPIRILTAGNPYTVYCPLFMELGVDTSKLKPGAFLVGPNYVISCFVIPEELKKKILAANPMYRFDNSYARYAFSGIAISDQNIKLQKTEPKGYKLKYVFKLGNDFLSVHIRGKKADKKSPKYWICSHGADWLEKVGGRRKIIVFNFGDMIDKSFIPTNDEKQEFISLSEAMKSRDTFFNCINAQYMMEDVLSSI